MYNSNDYSKNLIKYIAIVFILLAIILFLGLNLPGILFAEKNAEKEEDKAEKNAEKEEDKAEKDAEKEEDKAEKNAEKEEDKAEKDAEKEEDKAEKDAEKDAGEEDKAEKDAEKEEDKAEKDAGEEDLLGDNRIDTIKIKWNIPGLGKIKVGFDLDKNASNNINSIEELLEIIEITDQNQILDIIALMEENEIIDILDVNKIINEKNYIEIKYSDKENIKSRSDNSLEFLWNKINEFAYYYNS